MCLWKCLCTPCNCTHNKKQPKLKLKTHSEQPLGSSPLPHLPASQSVCLSVNEPTSLLTCLPVFWFILVLLISESVLTICITGFMHLFDQHNFFQELSALSITLPQLPKYWPFFVVTLKCTFDKSKLELLPCSNHLWEKKFSCSSKTFYFDNPLNYFQSEIQTT